MRITIDRVLTSFARKSIPLLLLAAFIFFGIPQAYAQNLLKIYYVRHAEGGHNVVDQWKDKPKDQWPAYVGNANVFTPKGEKQVAAVTKELQGMKFDFIAVSPLWRTRNTVLPYLKATNQKGEIWPELAETAGVSMEWTVPGGKSAKPSANLFEGGEAIQMPEAEKPFFTLREDGKLLLNANDKNHDTKTANSVAMAQKTVELIKARFSKSGKSILLVGHGSAGNTLLRTLTTSKDIKVSLQNTGIWMAEEQPDGSFKLKMLNSKPYVEK